MVWNENVGRSNEPHIPAAVLAAAVSDDDDKNETCNKFVSVILLQCTDKNATRLNNINDLHENIS